MAFIQPKIVGRFLTRADMQDPEIKAQLEEIMDGYRRKLEEGHPHLDLIGGKGALTGQISNIFVTPDKRLVIFDATLLSLDDFPI